MVLVARRGGFPSLLSLASVTLIVASLCLFATMTLRLGGVGRQETGRAEFNNGNMATEHLVLQLDRLLRASGLSSPLVACPPRHGETPSSTKCLLLPAHDNERKEASTHQSDIPRCIPMPVHLRRKVVSYFAPVEGVNPTEELRLVDYWKRSWYNYGWNPVILSEADAAQHPDYETLVPLINAQANLSEARSWSYQRSVYLQYLAAAAVGADAVSDIDVINYGLSPHSPLLAPPDKLAIYSEVVPQNVSDITIINAGFVTGSPRVLTDVARTLATFDIVGQIPQQRSGSMRMIGLAFARHPEKSSIRGGVIVTCTLDNVCPTRTPLIHFTNTPRPRWKQVDFHRPLPEKALETSYVLDHNEIEFLRNRCEISVTPSHGSV